MIISKKSLLFGVLIYFIFPSNSNGQIALEHFDSVKIIVSSEQLINDFDNLLGIITTGSEVDIKQAINYSFTPTAGLQYIILNDLIPVENDLDTTNYRNKIKKTVTIADYLNKFWSKYEGAQKKIAFTSGIVCDSLFARGDSVISVVYFNTVFDKKPYIFSKRKARISCKKIDNEWQFTIIEILFNDVGSKSNDFVGKYKNDIKDENLIPNLIPESTPLFYFTYKSPPVIPSSSDIAYKKANINLQDAEIQYAKQNFESASKYYIEADKLAPNNDFIQKRIANCFKLTWVPPKNIENLLRQYNTAFMQRSFYKASLYLDTASKLQPDNSAVIKLNEELNEAIAEYDQVKKRLENNPDDFQKFINDRLVAKEKFADIYYFFLAKYHFKTDNASAVANLSKALESKPYFIEAKKLNVKAQVIAVNCDKAQAEIRSLLADDPNNDTLRALKADALACSDQKKEAIAEYNYAIGIDPNNYEYYFNRGNLYYALKNLDLAINDFNKAISIKTDYTEANYNLFVIYYADLNKQDSSFIYLENANRTGLQKSDMEWCKGESKTRFTRGMELYQRRAMKEANDNFRYSANLDVSNHQAWYYSAKIDSFEMKNYKRAINSMSHAVKLQPGSMEYLLLLGRVQNADSQYDEAIKSFEVIQKSSTDKKMQRNAYEGVGDAYMGKHSDSRAQSSYKSALEYDPKNYFLLIKLADSYREGFSYDEAIKLYKNLISSWESGNEAAFFKIGLCYEGKKEYGNAIDNYAKVLEIKNDPSKISDPNYKPEVFYRIGLCYKNDDNCKRSIEYFNEQIRQTPGHKDSYLQMANCQFLLGKYSEAVKSYSFLVNTDEDLIKKDSLHCRQFAYACLNDPLYYDYADKFIAYGVKNYDQVYFEFLRGIYIYKIKKEPDYSIAQRYFNAQKLKDINRIKNDAVFKDLAKTYPELKQYIGK